MDEAISDVGLGSGVPFGLLWIWFWLYMIFMLLILLNMNLAIINEHYNDCFQELKTDPHAQSVWYQARDYLRFMLASRGYLPESDIADMLNHEKKPAHPG